MNTNRYKTKVTAIIGLALMFCSWTMAYAQQEQKFALAAKQNAQALHQYTWKSQTQIRKEGEVKATKLYSNRYAADGTVVQLLLEENSAKLPKFGIRGIVAKKKKEEAQELIEQLQRLAKAYAELPPAKMQEFMKTAKASLHHQLRRSQSQPRPQKAQKTQKAQKEPLVLMCLLCFTLLRFSCLFVFYVPFVLFVAVWRRVRIQ